MLTDTSYLNRLTGEAPRQIAAIDGGDGARFRVRTRAGGFAVEWDEWPFEWVNEQRFRVYRRFKAGPVDSVDTILTFEPREGGGARVGVHLELHAEDPLAALDGQLRHAPRRRGAGLERPRRRPGAGAPRPAPAAGAHAAARRRPRASTLERVQRELRATAPELGELIDWLCAHIARARATKSWRASAPSRCADEWGVDRRALLATCLSAVRAGLLELRWEIVCPSCRTGAERAAARWRRSRSTAPASSASSSSRSTSTTRSRRPSRPTPRSARSTSAPTASAARRARRTCSRRRCCPRGGEATLPAPTEAGRYRLFVRGGATIARRGRRRRAGDVARVDADRSSDAEAAARARRRASLTVRSTATPTSATSSSSARVGRSQAATRARGHRAARLPPRLLRRGAAARAVAQGRARDALLQRPDRLDAALRRRRRRAPRSSWCTTTSTWCWRSSSAHGGTLVKTIGDAVMAVFADDLAALRGVARRSCTRSSRSAATGSPTRATHIKLGVFAGPATWSPPTACSTTSARR